MRCEPRDGVAREAAAEIGTHEVMRAVGGGARDREHGEPERRKIFDEARFVELRAAVSARSSAHGSSCGAAGGVCAGGRWSFDMRASCPGLTRASIEKSAFIEEDGLPGHKRVQRVFNALCPAMTTDE